LTAVNGIKEPDDLPDTTEDLRRIEFSERRHALD
jgi:hypothetical protein